jgi:hypothetical protein
VTREAEEDYRGGRTQAAAEETTEGEALAISVPRTEASVIRHFQERMPYGLFVPDTP